MKTTKRWLKSILTSTMILGTLAGCVSPYTGRYTPMPRTYTSSIERPGGGTWQYRTTMMGNHARTRAKCYQC